MKKWMKELGACAIEGLLTPWVIPALILLMTLTAYSLYPSVKPIDVQAMPVPTAARQAVALEGIREELAGIRKALERKAD